MNLIKKSILFSAITLGLSACGGSGSDMAAPDNVHTDTGNTSTGNTSTGNTSTGNTDTGNTGTTQNDVSGMYLRADATNIAAAAPISGTDINIVKIGDKQIQLPIISPSYNARGFYVINGDTVSGSHMSYARYGAINVDPKTAAIFSQGKLTPVTEVPATGSANYSGRAVHVLKNSNSAYEGLYEDSQSTFTADFANKVLTGNITATGLAKPVELKANISGNTFSGTYEGTSTQGGFYGPAAAEISGVYRNEAQQFGGAFGASAQ